MPTRLGELAVYSNCGGGLRINGSVGINGYEELKTGVHTPLLAKSAYPAAHSQNVEFGPMPAVELYHCTPLNGAAKPGTETEL